MRIKIFFLCLILLFPILSEAAPTCSGSGTDPSVVGSYQCTAESCSQAHVAAAVTLVQTNGGGTVNIPAGDCSWDTYINVSLTGSIWIIGAGNSISYPGSNTILRLGAGSNTYFYVDYNQAGVVDYFRLSAMSLIPGHLLGGDGGIYIMKAKSWRLDHLYYSVTTQASSQQPAFISQRTGKGLVDNCFIEQNAPNIDTSTVASYFESTPQYSAGIPPDCYTGSATGCDCSVGSDPIHRSSTIAAGNTVISRLNGGGAATALINNTGGSGTGHVQRVYLYIESIAASPTVDLGSFTVDSGNILSTRATATGITVHQGLNILTAGVDFTAFDISTGDYLGVYLNNCTLASGGQLPAGGYAGTDASGHWILAGNQVGNDSVTYTPATNNVSLWAEIYDTEGILSTCEADWTTWFATDTDNVRTGGLYPRVFTANYKPTTTDDEGNFWEDNYVRWVQSPYEANWNSIYKSTLRYNQFMGPAPGGMTQMASQITAKEGGLFLHVHNNVFNFRSLVRSDISFDGDNKQINMVGDVNGYTDLRHIFAVNDLIDISGSTSNNKTITVTGITKTQITASGDTLTTEVAGDTVTLSFNGVTPTYDLFHFYAVNGLIYNNTIVNHSHLGSFWFSRYANTSMIPAVRQKNLHIFNNTYKNVTYCSSDGIGCLQLMQGDPYVQGLSGFGTDPGTGTYFFRAPQSGETLYGYAEYTYPHPLRGEGGSTPQSFTLGVGSQTFTIGVGSQTFTVTP